MYAKRLGRMLALTAIGCCWCGNVVAAARPAEQANADGEAVPATAPAHLAELDLGPSKHALARIDRAGRLQFYISDGKRWKDSSATIVGPTLVGCAPLRLVRDPSEEVPIAYTIGARGEMLEIRGGKQARRVSGLSTRFAPGGQIELFKGRRAISLFSVDGLGRIWEVDVTDTQHRMVEARHGQFDPGAWIRADASSGNQLFLVDRRGALVAYRRTTTTEWIGPELIAEGFVSASPLAVWSPLVMPGEATESHIALVDRQGKMQLYRQRGPSWINETLPATLFSPATPIGVCRSATESCLAAVTPNGRLTEILGIAGQWVERPILDGFPLRAPVLLSAVGPGVFAIDIADRIVAGTRQLGEWHCVLCVPGATDPPSRVVRRELKSNSSERMIDMEFWNSSSHDIVVELTDRRNPGQTLSQTLRPGAAVRFPVDVRQGGKLEETVLVRTRTGKSAEEAQTLEVPPQAFHDVSVHLRRGTFSYIDRRRDRTESPKAAAISTVRLGTFPLFPGEPTTSASRIDVVREIDSRSPLGAGSANRSASR